MRKNTLFQRMQVMFNFIVYGQGKVRIMTCDKCGSIVILPITKEPLHTSSITNEKHIDSIYSEFVECGKCGAVCQEIQLWNFEGDPKKIDPYIGTSKDPEN